MKKLLIACVLLPGATLFSPPNVYANQIYYSQTDWETAVNAALTVDHFDNAKSSANSITFDSGVISTRSYSGDLNYVSSNKFYFGGVSANNVVSNTITWIFPGAIDAFGFTVTSLNNHTSITGNYSGTGNTSIDPATLTRVNIYNGFIGVIGDAPFTSIVFSGSNSMDSFSVDDLMFHTAATPAVPDTGTTAAMLTAALLGLAALWRKMDRA